MPIPPARPYASARPDAPASDRSVPRARVAAGDDSADRRGRRRAAPALLSYGFRPFFLGGALWAAVAVPLWLWMYFTGAKPAGPFAGVDWHVHEMLFGYIGAVVAGFVLTAVPNWTGRLPLSGGPLAGLVLLWLAGRLGNAALPWPIAALLADLAFPLALAAAVWREIAAGRNFRNAPVALLLTLFAAAGALDHLAQLLPALAGYGVRLALAVATMLMALIGGRIVPSFTRNWLARQQAERLPPGFTRLDQWSLAVAAAALAAWVARPEAAVVGALLVAAGLLHLVRLARWRGFAARSESIVLVLHVGYLWLAVALLLIGVSTLAPQALPPSAALHALTVGAVATMTLAVMTRASLGHTGRPIAADSRTAALYALVTLAALLRVAAPLVEAAYVPLLFGSAAAWSGAFGLFVAVYGPMLVGARADRRAP